MAGVGGPGALLLCALLLPFAQLSTQVPDCQEVRSSFQLLHPGMKWAPESPVSGNPPFFNRLSRASQYPSPLGLLLKYIRHTVLKMFRSDSFMCHTF